MHKKLLLAAYTAIYLAFGATSSPALAEQSSLTPPTPYAIDYALYAGGLRVVDVDVTYAQGNGHYEVTAGAVTSGIWKSLVPWRNDIFAQGKVAQDGGLQVERAVYDTYWRDKPKSVEMLYDAQGFVTTIATPPHKPDGRTEATPEQLQYSLDTLSAVVQVLAKGGLNGCQGSIPAYDGRRLYKLILNNKGEQVLRESRYSMFAGPALRCEVTFEPVAGFPIKETRAGFWNARDNEKKNNPLIIWLAKPAPDAPELPVRVQSTVQLGTLIAHIKSLSPATTDIAAVEPTLPKTVSNEVK